MSEFKKGDGVNVISRRSVHYGKQGYIQEIKYSGNITVEIDDSDYIFLASELEIFDPAEPTFSKGDFVRINMTGSTHGVSGTVITDLNPCNGMHLVKLNSDGSERWYKPSSLVHTGREEGAPVKAENVWINDVVRVERTWAEVGIEKTLTLTARVDQIKDGGEILENSAGANLYRGSGSGDKIILVKAAKVDHTNTLVRDAKTGSIWKFKMGACADTYIAHKVSNNRWHFMGQGYMNKVDNNQFRALLRKGNDEYTVLEEGK